MAEMSLPHLFVKLRFCGNLIILIVVLWLMITIKILLYTIFFSEPTKGLSLKLYMRRKIVSKSVENENVINMII